MWHKVLGDSIVPVLVPETGTVSAVGEFTVPVWAPQTGTVLEGIVPVLAPETGTILRVESGVCLSKLAEILSNVYFGISLSMQV